MVVKGTDGKRTKMVKHVLGLILREAYSQFIKEEKDKQISLDTFSKLRPANILLRHNMSKNVCVCKQHENTNVLIKALHSHKDTLPSNHQELISATTCQQAIIETQSCQTRQCKECQPLGTLEHLTQMLQSSHEITMAWYVKYNRWEEEEDREGKKRIRKIEKNESILQQLHQDWLSLKMHRLIKVHECRIRRTVQLEEQEQSTLAV